MPVFYGKAVDARGDKVRFTRESVSKETLIGEMKTVGLIPLKIRSADRKMGHLKKRFPKSAVADLTETLSLLLNSGLSLKDSLAIILTIFRKGPVHEVSAELLEGIQKGASLYQALEAFELSFPPIYRGLVKIGEKIGGLENIFNRLAGYLKERKRLRDRLTNTLVYPLFILGISIVGIALLIVFIIPSIEEIYVQLAAGFPEELRQRIGVLDTLITRAGLFIPLLLVSAVLFRWLKGRSDALREKWERLAMRLPLLGRFRLLRDSLTFLFAMETLTESGFPVEDALAESCGAVDNLALRTSLRTIEAKIRRGKLLSQAFMEDPLFSERISQWLVVGERSGNVEKVFQQLRAYYEAEMERWTARLMTLAEPVFMILVGIIIMIFLLTFILPLFSIYRTLL